MGQGLPVNQSALAAELGTHHPVLRLPAGNPESNLRPEGSPVGDKASATKSIDMSLRKVIKTCSSFPSDEAMTELFYLAPKNIRKNRRCQFGTAKPPQTASQSNSTNGRCQANPITVYRKFRTPAPVQNLPASTAAS